MATLGLLILAWSAAIAGVYVAALMDDYRALTAYIWIMSGLLVAAPIVLIVWALSQ